jgi:hypothetical protein
MRFNAPGEAPDDGRPSSRPLALRTERVVVTHQAAPAASATKSAARTRNRLTRETRGWPGRSAVGSGLDDARARSLRLATKAILSDSGGGARAAFAMLAHRGAAVNSRMGEARCVSPKCGCLELRLQPFGSLVACPGIP